MLKRVNELPTDKRIAGIHSIPLLEDGSIMMVWDRNEQTLTTVGGRIEPGESIDEALDRETVEEAGLLLMPERIPVACWYWTETDTYTVFVVAKVHRFVPMPEGFETTGRVTFNFETAKQVVNQIEGHGQRILILNYAEEAASQIFTT
ncbi:NUDIX domain-containing protein [Paenibacillus sp. FSL K6-3182]|uniref:NUDIX domain-containing protein n=1 Tax=Paenibacillus sp. FSL K6-3182 TaxID=2921495 RepID=UPI0030CFABA0